jgi:hypothetical protein
VAIVRAGELAARIRRLIARYRHRSPQPLSAAGLDAAVKACGFVCLECQSTAVWLDWSPLLGFVPTITHDRLPDGTWCPCTWGGDAAALASLDLIDALAACVAVGDYGEQVWHRRERVS